MSPADRPRFESELLLCVQKVQVHPCISREGLEKSLRALQPVSADSCRADGPTKQLSGMLGAIPPWETQELPLVLLKRTPVKDTSEEDFPVCHQPRHGKRSRGPAQAKNALCLSGE